MFRKKEGEKLRIISPMVPGNGAYIVHSQLEQALANYSICPISSLRSIYPPLIRRSNYEVDIVHTVPEYGRIYKRNSSTKLVVTFHNYFWDGSYIENSSFLKGLFYRYIQSKEVALAIEKADVVTTVSNFTRGLILDQYPGLEVKVIYNGVDLKQFKLPNEEVERKCIYVLFSGNPTKRKGLYVLQDLSKRVSSNIKFIITGGLRKNTMNLKGSNVELLGNIAHEEMPELYQRADVLLLPSAREGLSLSVIEAMASGLPVLSFDSSSMSELIVDGKGGYLCPKNNLSCLIDSLQALAENPALRKNMGDFNRSRAIEHFSMIDMINSYKRMFDGIL